VTQQNQRERALETIRQNIARSGHHIYVVSDDGQTPRFAYTIGASESVGFELILAGAIFYMKDEVVTILNEIVAQRKAHPARDVYDVDRQGSFTLRDADDSWARELLLGAFDYYKRDVRVRQVFPDVAHSTLDVPNMSAPWSVEKEPVWQWLREPWQHPVPENSTAATNLAALRGSRITEVTRWEEDYWEIFAGAGPDVPKSEIRVVSLGTLLAVDESLIRVLNLEIGSGLWRDAASDWHPWKTRENSEGARSNE
jgi:hypothetical protein